MSEPLWHDASNHQPGHRMIDIGSPADLLSLADVSSECCVSMYLPTHRAGKEVFQDPVRLKNLLASAAGEIEGWDGCRTKPSQLLSAARALVDDTDFWAHGDAGLAVLVDTRGTLTVRLAEPVHEVAVVADRFHLKPLVAMSSGERAFHVLAVSLGSVRLLRGGRAGASEVHVENLPQGMPDALQWDDRERQLQSHGAGRVGRGRVTAAFHGQGGAKDSHDADVVRYLRIVDHAVEEHLGVVDGGPIVLAGVAELVAEFRRISRLPHIVDGAVTGNPDELTASELLDRAWPLVEPLAERPRREAAERFLAKAAPTLDMAAAVVGAAEVGRVESLFVPIDVEQWGHAEQGGTREDAERRPGDRDLFDVAAIETIRHGGSVYTVPAAEIPGGGQVAANLRF